MEQYIGQIKLFAGNFAPKDWAFCDGQLLPIAQNTALFSLLGTTYGGNGTTTFALPDLKGAAVMHPSNNKPLGSKGGSMQKFVNAENIPPHSHTVTAAIKSKSSKDTKNSPVGSYPANSEGFDREYQSAADKNMAADAIVVTSVSTEGTPTPQPAILSNMQPYLAVNFIIALTGEWPPRS